MIPGFLSFAAITVCSLMKATCSTNSFFCDLLSVWSERMASVKAFNPLPTLSFPALCRWVKVTSIVRTFPVLIDPTTLLSTLILFRIIGPLGIGGRTILAPFGGNPEASSIWSAAKLTIDALRRKAIVRADSNLCQQSTHRGSKFIGETLGLLHWLQRRGLELVILIDAFGNANMATVSVLGQVATPPLRYGVLSTAQRR